MFREVMVPLYMIHGGLYGWIYWLLREVGKSRKDRNFFFRQILWEVM